MLLAGYFQGFSRDKSVTTEIHCDMSSYIMIGTNLHSTCRLHDNLRTNFLPIVKWDTDLLHAYMYIYVYIYIAHCNVPIKVLPHLPHADKRGAKPGD